MELVRSGRDHVAVQVGLTREFLRDLQELRRVVEPAAVRLAAERATAAGHRRDRGRLRRHEARRWRRAATTCAYDLRFHQGLLRACHNRMMVQMSKALSALLRTSFEISTTPHGRPQASRCRCTAPCWMRVIARNPGQGREGDPGR